MPSRRVDTARDADADLQQILDYTRERWGDAQRFRYSQAINRALRQLREFPFAGRDRSDLGPGIRSYPVAEHVIIYLVRGDHILIVRILHGSEDIASAFAEPEDE